MLDAQRLHALAHREGLTAGLGAVLQAVPVRETAPGGVAAVPAHLAVDGETVPNRLAALEGIRLVRLPGTAGGGLAGTWAARLAAVRAGALSRLLEQAVERLSLRTFDGTRLIDLQMVTGDLADVVAELEVLRLATGAAEEHEAPAPVVADWHATLGELGWSTAKFFGAEGYIEDHPARVVHVSALVANLCLAKEAQR
ncbi:acyl-CoA dehydrogenase family protein [Streptomyces sp. NPDC056528]|uniref:acyl-CoA dehydrogenase family protein n=1 Tax=Streptomyces sp. NPDC056528 TaxID=3345854 RepID=UPI0036A56E0F